MLDWLFQTFRDNPVIPIFLTLGLGFWLGALKWKAFSLGPVTATLLVGVIIGQIGIPMSEQVKSLAFMLFLFSIGYSIGPQFFRSLKGDGLKQIAFALVEASVCVITVVLIAKVMGYNPGIAVGLFAGSQTVSATIGVGADTIRSMSLDPDVQKSIIDYIPATYAVCYVFGTIGSAWIIANLGPILLGGLKKVREETARLEEELDSGDFRPDPGQFVANRPISFRAYRAESPFFDKPRTVRDIEHHVLHNHEHRYFVERLRINGEIMDADPDLRVRRGDTIVLSGRREAILADASWVGPEVTDHELLTFSTENLPVCVSKAGAAGVSIGELRRKPYMHGVMINKVLRNEIPLAIRRGLKLEKGDVVHLIGLPEDVAAAVPEIGYSDRDSYETDMVFVGLGIAIGCLIGAIVIQFGGIPVTLSTSGGAILAGLIMSWARSRRPSCGHIPRQVLWFMDNAGLNIFIAVVGLAAGPSFIEGLREIGFEMLFVGVLATSIPLIISIFIAAKIFRFPAAIALGCVAGSRNAVAALGAIQDSVDSTIPALSYTVTYAVGSVVLIFAGLIIPLVC
ncbi:MAG: aspartate-alanine antiporter [Muribaculaceae bacterium]|nr:aspartate-alanine antiporter [Muribaculaceae bacterium]